MLKKGWIGAVVLGVCLLVVAVCLGLWAANHGQADACVVEGCTPGYWKQEQHFDSWTPPYDPPDKFSDVFGRLITVRAGGKNTATDPTLLEALHANGGGINALVRHGVAALLNAASPGVSYAYSPAEVIAGVQSAIDSGDYQTTKNMLADENERGCPLN